MNFFFWLYFVYVSYELDFDLRRNVSVSNYGICRMVRQCAFSQNYCHFDCNKYLNSTQCRHTPVTAHFVRYRYVRNEFATDGEFSETRLKLGTKCRANLFLRGGCVDEKSISKAPGAKSGMFDTLSLSLSNNGNEYFCDSHMSFLLLSFRGFLTSLLESTLPRIISLSVNYSILVRLALHPDS